MSGGHFGYAQNRLEDIALSIDELIALNDSTKKDKYGYQEGNQFPKDIIEKFELTAYTLRQAMDMVQRVDWLVSDDDGVECFRERWKDEVRGY